jgi:16S rRNA processing protein RimM
MAPDPKRVVLAEILRERGNKGEVAARSQTDIPGRLESLKAAWLHLADGSDRAVEIEQAWPHKGDWVLKFALVNSISEAEKLRGSDLWVPIEERAPLPAGEYYESDLIGCVVRPVGGETIGIVTGMQRFGGAPLLEVDRNGRDVLIPFVPGICHKVDLGEREIQVELPDGLLDL